MRVGEYMVNERTLVVHIREWSARRTIDKVLCGVAIDGSEWVYGDETASGHSATCKRCKSIFRKAAQEPVKPRQRRRVEHVCPACHLTCEPERVDWSNTSGTIFKCPHCAHKGKARTFRTPEPG